MQISQCPSQNYNQTLESHSLSVFLAASGEQEAQNEPPSSDWSSEKICNIPDLKPECQILPSLYTTTTPTSILFFLNFSFSFLAIHSSLPLFIQGKSSFFPTSVLNSPHWQGGTEVCSAARMLLLSIARQWEAINAMI